MTTSRGPFWRISEWEFREAVRRTRETQTLPLGQRAEALRRIAADYDVSTRTLYRWLTYTVQPVRCGKYEALFIIGKRGPSQATPWERAA